MVAYLSRAMNTPPETKITYRYCGRLFSSQQIDHIRDLIASDQHYNRAELSRLVCENLHWLRPMVDLRICHVASPCCECKTMV